LAIGCHLPPRARLARSAERFYSEIGMPERHSDVAKRVWFRLIRLESRLAAAVAERLREIGLSVPQCDVLTTLTEEEGLSQQMLAKRLYVTKGNISGLLDRLESAGLVERRSTAGDRRSYEIHLTPSGREAATKAIAIQEAVIQETFGRMPDGDLEIFERMLVSLREIMREGAAAAPESGVYAPDEPLQQTRP
jgi:DNA-binding MarR family transcriptional regulator